MGDRSRTPSITGSMISDQPRQMASTAGRGGKWYRGVTPHVAPDRRDGLQDWKHAYETRFMTTSNNRWQENTRDCVDQCAATHADKQVYFRQHSLPNLTWMDLGELTHQRSRHQKQPCYFADVGGPPRGGVMPRAVYSHVDAKCHQPHLNLMSKAGRSFGS